MKKKILALILSFTMLVTLIPASMITVSAQEAESGTCGDNLTWTMDTNGVLTISGAGDMTDWDFDDTPWESVKDTIREVIIEYGVTSIGNYAFSDCVELVSITIADSVTDIGEAAFGYCTELTNIIIPDSVTDIGDAAFSECYSLTGITIPDSVIDLGSQPFTYCSQLAEINVDTNNSVYASEDGVLFNKNKTNLIRYPEGKPEIMYEIPVGVTDIGDNAFDNCEKLTDIVISDSVINIGGYAFSGCGLKSLAIPDGVTNISESAFMNCFNLKEITVDSNNPSFAAENGVLFDKNKTKLIRYPQAKTGTSYEIPDNVTVIGDNSFCSCIELISVTIPDSVKLIGFCAFFFCNGLTSVTIPASVTGIESFAFMNCSNLTDVYYYGTEENLKIITKNSVDLSVDFSNATIHYLQAEPTPAETVDFTSTENVAYGKNIIPKEGRNYYSKSSTVPSAESQLATDGDITTWHQAAGRDHISWGTRVGSEFSIDLEGKKNITSVDLYVQPAINDGAIDRANSSLSINIYGGKDAETGTLIGQMTVPAELTSVTSDGKTMDMYVYHIDFPAGSVYDSITFEESRIYYFGFNEIYVAGTEAENPTPEIGDVNGDGEADFIDAIAVLKHDAGILFLTDDKLIAADTNGDGEVDFVDAIQILKYDCGLITSFN